MDFFVANLSSKVKKTTLNGRSFLVAEGTIIVEDVLVGSDGAIFYPVNSFAANASDWNGQPIVVYHPMKDGRPVSAKDPEVLQKSMIGMLLNSKVNKDRIGVQYWFDEELTKEVDYRVYDDLINGRPIRVSTGAGVLRTEAPEGAVFNGRSYSYEAKMVVPDHLAILPDEEAACGIEAGCGVFVTNESGKPNALVGNKLSHSDIRMGLRKLMSEKFGNDEYGMSRAYVEEVYDKEFIYSVNEKLYRGKYVTDNRTGKLEVKEEAEEVQRVISYKPVTANSLTDEGDDRPNHSEGDEMSKKTKQQLIDHLVANCDCWKADGSKEILSGFDETRLESLVKNAEEKATLIANSKKETNVTQTNAADAKKVEGADKARTLQEWLEEAPPEVREVVQNAREVTIREKQELIGKLTANLEGDEKKQASELLAQEPVGKLKFLVRVVNSANAKKAAGPWDSINWGEQPSGAGGYDGAGANPDTVPSPTVNRNGSALTIERPFDWGD